MYSHVEQALVHLNAALVEVEAAPSHLLHRTLGVSKELRSRVEVLETRVAAVVAKRERHGDGGAGLLREHSGLSRSEAARNVRAEAELAAIPDAQTGVTDGKISLANAAKLADAARKVSPDAVQGDSELIGLAKVLPADEFALAAQRWTARHQDAADLAAQHRRNRRNRNVRFWNGDDGSVQMRGSFDAEMGARIQERLRRHAEQLRQADRRLSAGSHAGSGSAADNADGRDVSSDGDSGAAARTADQRMADALDMLLANGAAAARGGSNSAVAAGRVADSNSADTDAAAAQDSTAAADSTAGTGAGGAARSGATANSAGVAGAGGVSGMVVGSDADVPTRDGRKAAAEIVVRADWAALIAEPGALGALAEICGVGPIPPSTLERLACNSDVWVEIFGDQLTPLYETVVSRAPTAAQRRALIARDGACVGCGTPPGDCEAHHIIPVVCRGKTRLDNLVLVCWRCHDRIHDHNWQVVVREGRYRLIPPDPARPPNPAPSRKPKPRTPHGPRPAAGSQESLSMALSRQPSLLATAEPPLTGAAHEQSQPAA